ncbi:MAG: glycosyltransferase family 4 protein [Planctomycetota bacterium]
MKICFVRQEFPPETGHGGIAAYTYTLSRALARLGHKVFVISATHDSEEKSAEIDGVGVLRLPLSAPKVVTERKAVDLISYSKRVAAAVRSLHDREGLDIVEFPDLAAEGHAFIRNGKPPIPAITRIHTPLYLIFKHDRRKWTAQTRAMSELENEVIRNSPFLTSPSRFVAGRVSEDLGLDTARFRVLPNPVDCERFVPAKMTDNRTILCAGRLQWLKGTHTLVQAVPQILDGFPRARFVFAGRDTASGPKGMSYKDWMLGTLSKRHWRGLEFLDHVASAEIPALYRNSAVVVVPSLYENFPNVCLEAMASGMPLVASNVGGIPEMVEDGRTGILVPPGDPAALADAICELMGNPQLRAELGRNARKSMLARFDSPVIAKEAIPVYEEAVEVFEKEFSHPCPG